MNGSVSNDTYLVVGAGYAGSVMAERLASAGRRCIVIDRRPHVAGNAYDELDNAGVLIHKYGPHIFHTNSDAVFAYLSRFTDWRAYEHRVLSAVDGRLYPFPINRRTLEMVFEKQLSEDDAKALIEQIREPHERVTNSEELVLNSVGRKLYEMFFYGYTLKQWGRPPSTLSSGVAARIPVRTNDDDRYFTDKYQFMPLHGYTRMFENMLDHPLIETRLSTDFAEWRHLAKNMNVVYSGPIDAFYDYRLGYLPYRSLRFEFEHLDSLQQFQRVGTVNYPNTETFTRITEFKHLSGQTHTGTSIVREYPSAEGDPYYPIPAPENEQLFKEYQALAEREERVTFIGRLAQYRYYNMDQVVGAALVAAERLGAEPALAKSR